VNNDHVGRFLGLTPRATLAQPYSHLFVLKLPLQAPSPRSPSPTSPHLAWLTGMPRRLTEQTPLLGKARNVPVGADVDVDVDVERGGPIEARKTSSQVPVAAAPAPAGAEVDHVVESGSGGSGSGGSSTTVTTTTMTPIPWRQLLTLCLVRLIDPICFSQIFPYINDMLLDMRVVGPNEPERVGLYSGLIESTFSVAVALAIYPWARLSGMSGLTYVLCLLPQDNLPLWIILIRRFFSSFSDQVGRKPVLLYGIIGATAAMVSFGMGNRCAPSPSPPQTTYPSLAAPPLNLPFTNSL
jgi:hypothetical protein